MDRIITISLRESACMKLKNPSTTRKQIMNKKKTAAFPVPFRQICHPDAKQKGRTPCMNMKLPIRHPKITRMPMVKLRCRPDIRPRRRQHRSGIRKIRFFPLLSSQKAKTRYPNGYLVFWYGERDSGNQGSAPSSRRRWHSSAPHLFVRVLWKV